MQRFFEHMPLTFPYLLFALLNVSVYFYLPYFLNDQVGIFFLYLQSICITFLSTSGIYSFLKS